jgi:hypothetical protein
MICLEVRNSAMKHIRCRNCKRGLISGVKMFPQKDGSHLCESCLPPVIKDQEPPQIHISTEMFTGIVPVRYVEAVDVT